MANDELAGTIGVEALSLSWTGPTEIRGVKIVDPQRHDVLTIRRISSPAGLWQLITGAEAFGELRVEAPEVTLYIDADNRISLAEAFQRRTASSSSPTASSAWCGPAASRTKSATSPCA